VDGRGWTLALDANGNLLLGIPLTLLFELGVRRRPVRELRVRDGTSFAVPGAWRAAVAALVILPPVGAVYALQSRPCGVAFVLEEVTFRGALDAHVSEAMSGRPGAVLSAVLVAAGAASGRARAHRRMAQRVPRVTGRGVRPKLARILRPLLAP
jgi:hypothetical protein